MLMLMLMSKTKIWHLPWASSVVVKGRCVYWCCSWCLSSPGRPRFVRRMLDTANSCILFLSFGVRRLHSVLSWPVDLCFGIYLFLCGKCHNGYKWPQHRQYICFLLRVLEWVTNDKKNLRVLAADWRINALQSHTVNNMHTGDTRTLQIKIH